MALPAIVPIITAMGGAISSIFSAKNSNPSYNTQSNPYYLMYQQQQLAQQNQQNNMAQYMPFVLIGAALLGAVAIFKE